MTIFLVGWVLIRALTIWSGEILQDYVRAEPSSAVAPGRSVPVGTLSHITSGHVSTHAKLVLAARPTPVRLTIEQAFIPKKLNMPIKRPVTRAVPRTAADSGIPAELALSIVPTPAAAERASAPAGGAHSRWSGSAWLLVRGDEPDALGTGGELGGSQTGIRLFYDLDRPVAATARVSRALSKHGGEASVGIAIRHRNVGLLLERRVALDRAGRNEFSATAYGGFSEVAVVHDVRLDGYLQAGIVGKDKFVDGAVRVERTVSTLAETRVSVGAGLWGGAQPGVERLDIGPQIVARGPIEGRTVRVSAEWRERIAGGADPGSGPSVTLGIDL